MNRFEVLHAFGRVCGKAMKTILRPYHSAGENIFQIALQAEVERTSFVRYLLSVRTKLPIPDVWIARDASDDNTAARYNKRKGIAFPRKVWNQEIQGPPFQLVRPMHMFALDRRSRSRNWICFLLCRGIVLCR